jgi:leucyl-tRNA synthetase
LWKAVFSHVSGGAAPVLDADALNDRQKAFRRKVHETVRKVGDDVGRRYTFNTAIAANMELLNEVGRFKDDSHSGRAVLQEALQLVVLMLSPIVPHISQPLWLALGHADSVVDQAWPQADEGALVKDSVELVVQVNGKVRGRISVAADAGDEIVIDTALAEPNVKRFMQGRALRKSIVVAGRLVNLVLA